MKILQIALQSVVVLSVSLLTLSADPIFNVTDLGTLGGLSCAQSINELGQVVGFSTLPNNQTRAFVYAQGRMWDLGTLMSGSDSYATAINNKGQVVGTAYATGYSHAFLFQNGQMQDLGTLGGKSSEAHSINDNGVIVGVADISSGDQRGFYYLNNKMFDLGTLGFNSVSSSATYINNNNEICGIVGNYPDPLAGGHGFILRNGTAIDLSVLAAPNAYPRGLSPVAYSNSDLLVGSTAVSRSPGDFKGFVFDGALHEVSFVPASITETGIVVGTIIPNSLAIGQATVAVIYFQGVTFHLDDLADLAHSNFTSLQNATGINNSAQIVGAGLTKDGTTHAFLLTLKTSP